MLGAWTHDWLLVLAGCCGDPRRLVQRAVAHPAETRIAGTSCSISRPLEQQLTGEVAAAADEAALEAVRVAALGKSGSVSALLQTLGTMTPDERKLQGPAINGLKDRVTAAIAARKDALKNAALDASAQQREPSTSRCRCARRRPRAAASIRSAR